MTVQTKACWLQTAAKHAGMFYTGVSSLFKDHHLLFKAFTYVKQCTSECGQYTTFAAQGKLDWAPSQGRSTTEDTFSENFKVLESGDLHSARCE